MADPVPQGNEAYLSEMDIRIWLRDTDPEANKLLDDWEFGQEEIRTAMTLAIDFWNEEPPHIPGYHIANFPYRHALLKGTAANLLFIASNLYRRNRLQYRTAGGGVTDQDKAPTYDAAGDRLWQEYVSWVRRNKRSLNMQLGWGLI